MKLTIVQRMALLTGVALVGVLSMAMLGQYQMGRSFHEANLTNVNVIPSLTLLGDMRKSFLLARITLARRVLEEKDSQQAFGLEARLQNLRKDVEIAFEHYSTDGCQGASCFVDE
ncbi:MAG: Tar ligand binding domain-containing protein, partial [Paucibacter sp.]|nr:Tar ligand binding domain-containing protein [Roseateles sp.]